MTEYASVDDHSHSEMRGNAHGECTAAECLQSEPVAAERLTHESIVRARLRPFAWQSGRRLLLLECEQGFWVLAELRFEPKACRYTELRRAVYRWEREAVGALLSRAISEGNEAASEAAEHLATWMRHRDLK